ncbi:MAG: hypothetical protein H6825_08420 [Planctomycetes bacterium]|nr:hypothetical protein [Planctomycetota bacterium]
MLGPLFAVVAGWPERPSLVVYGVTGGVLLMLLGFELRRSSRTVRIAAVAGCVLGLALGLTTTDPWSSWQRADDLAAEASTLEQSARETSYAERRAVWTRWALSSRGHEAKARESGRLSLFASVQVAAWGGWLAILIVEWASIANALLAASHGRRARRVRRRQGLGS